MTTSTGKSLVQVTYTSTKPVFLEQDNSHSICKPISTLLLTAAVIIISYLPNTPATPLSLGIGFTATDKSTTILTLL